MIPVQANPQAAVSGSITEVGVKTGLERIFRCRATVARD